MVEFTPGQEQLSLAAQLMTLDILKQGLQKADHPDAMGTYLVDQLRELTDAQTVILFQCLHAVGGHGHRIVSVTPESHRPLVESESVGRLVQLIHSDVIETTLWKRETAGGDAQEALAELGYNLSVVMPLNAGSVRVGALLFLDLPDARRAAQVVQVLDLLSTVVALVFRNALLFGEQKATIERIARELKESETGYRELADSITDVFFAMGGDLRYTYWNKASEDLTGISAEDAIGKTFYEIFPEMKGSEVERMYLDVLRTRRPRSLVSEYQIKDKDCFFEISAYPSERGLSVFVKDITKRMQAESALRKKEKQYRILFENANDAIYLIEPETDRILDCNNKAAEISGYSVAELKTMAVVDLHPVEERPTLPEIFAMIDKRGSVTGISGLHHVKKNGQLVPIEISATMVEIDGRKLNLSIVRDITERKRAEEALRESEQKFHALVEQAAEMLYLHDMNGNIVDVNQATISGTGYSREELLNMRLPDIDPDYVEREDQGQFWDILESQDPFTFQARHRRKDGTIFPVEVTLGKVTLQNGTYILGLVRDITERVRAQEELAEIFAMSLDMICIADINTATFVKVNPAFTRILGYTEKELLERPFLDFVHPDDVESTVAVIEEKLWAGERVINFENRYRCKDGTFKWLNWLSHPAPEKGVTYAVARDITERKRAGDALQQAHDKLEERVAERTAELQKLVNAMVGREVRMAELKDVIRQLRAQLKEAGIEPVADDPLLGKLE